jgi:hypothetical protein
MRRFAPFIDIAVADIAKAIAVTEDMKRASVALIGCARGLGGGSGIVKEYAGLIAGASVIHPFEDKISTLEVAALQMAELEIKGVRPYASAAAMMRRRARGSCRNHAETTFVA